MSFLPISVDALQVGLYIKLDHGWREHPFLRSSFKIRSQKDIAIIRKHKLTKISYHPTLSDSQALEGLAASPESENRADPKKEVVFSKEELEEADFSLQEEKEKLIQDLVARQSAQQMISLGQSEGLDLCKQMVGAMMEILDGPSPTLTLVNAPILKNITEQVSVHSVNVCSLALLVADTLDLTQEDRQTLGLGALLHNIGLHRVPPAVRGKRKDALSPKETQMLEAYPYYGRQMVERLSGISPDGLDIISHHRESLDGSGYPQGLKGTHISFLPRVVRVVTEYNALINNGEGSDRHIPTDALRYLYTQMREKCDPDIIDAFIVSVTVYPPGSFVRLTDDSIALVLKSNKAQRLRPLVGLYETTRTSDNPAFIDLAQEPQLAIKESVNPQDLDPKILAHLHQDFEGIKGFFVST
jgi:HD-GYP domain-containing protein (c-di-GMP phosphodiesterase class II)